MNQIRQNISLTKLNTFGLQSITSKYFDFDNEKSLQDFILNHERDHDPLHIISGGSNILLPEKVEGVVLQSKIKGVNKIFEDSSSLMLEVGGGEEWDDFVAFCVGNNLYGIENLSLIPGHVGASPVQNIGAYGVEVGDLIESVHGIDLYSGNKMVFQKQECQFGYRSSIFKKQYKGRLLITKVVFRLNKQAALKLDYGDVKQLVLNMEGGMTLKNVRRAIIQIREAKLPDPTVKGNAGSFFKNPVVENDQAKKIIDKYPSAPHYKVDELQTKIPAGWLIEQSGWKGKSLGPVGVHEKQALVLVNNGGASLRDVLQLSDAIIKSVKNEFGIILEREVNILE